MSSRKVVAAFNEDHVASLTGLKKGRLRSWHKTGFFEPEYAEEGAAARIGRVYSFKDVASLSILKVLRDDLGVSLQHLRRTKEKLASLDEHGWSGTVLYVLNGKVIVKEPADEPPREVVSGQLVIDLPLERVSRKMHDAVAHMAERQEADFGQVARRRGIHESAPVLAGTRIPVSAIRSFESAGYTVDQILKEYPSLTEADVQAALSYGNEAA